MKNLLVVLSAGMLFFAFLAFADATQDVISESDNDQSTLFISGILVDKNSDPMPNQNMTIYLNTRKPSVGNERDGSEKPGIGKKIEGTGTMNMSVVGVDGGGAYKLIDGRVVNPSAKTDKEGRFTFEATEEFIAGEIEFLVTRNQQNSKTFVTESYPMIDENGEPIKLKFDSTSMIMELGKIRTLSK